MKGTMVVSQWVSHIVTLLHLYLNSVLEVLGIVTQVKALIKQHWQSMDNEYFTMWDGTV